MKMYEQKLSEIKSILAFKLNLFLFLFVIWIIIYKLLFLIKLSFLK